MRIEAEEKREEQERRMAAIKAAPEILKSLFAIALK